MSSPQITLMAGLCSLFIALCAFIYSTPRRKIPLPPGPPTNWSLDPKVAPYASFQDLERLVQEYGPVVTLRSGCHPTIMIGRRQEAIELMEKEGSALADRPPWVAASDILSSGMRVLLLNAGKRFRKLRRALHTHLQIKALGDYEALQMRHGRDMILDIMHIPENHICHAKRFAASFILCLTYGKTAPTSASDPEVIAIHLALKRIGMAVRPGAHQVDKYPLLRYIPFYGQDLRRWRYDELSLFRRQLGSVKQSIADVGACFGKYLIEHQKQLELTDDEMAYLAGSMFGAGSSTTSSTISFIIMAAACFPETQRVVQKQLDQIIGKDRAPLFSDRESLSQVTAFIFEVYRWRPVAGSGFAHRATKDIIWNGYCIPKGSIVTGNHWSICRDPLFFDDPELFDPTRWLVGDQIKDDLLFFNYGFGRRVCPGRHLADKSVFLCAALLLWSFNISQDLKSPIDTTDLVSGVSITPKDFSACFEPRIPNLEDVLTHYSL